MILFPVFSQTQQIPQDPLFTSNFYQLVSSSKPAMQILSEADMQHKSLLSHVLQPLITTNTKLCKLLICTGHFPDL